MAKSATHWHRGEGEPRATNGQAQKTLVDHRKLIIERKQARLVYRKVAVVFSRKIK